MSTSLIKPDNAQLVTYREDQISLIKDTFAKGATDSELKLFIAVAERKGLDIFSRQIHLVKRYDKKLNRDVMEVQTGIDGYRLIAERTGRYEGQIGPMWCGNDGNWKDVWLAKEPPAAAKVGILKSGAKEPFFGIALYREYVQTYKEGNPFPMWAKMPANQLAKCAEALALRKAFPGELSGIYTQEEMAQAATAEDVIDIEPIREEKPVKPLALVPPVESEGEPLRLRSEQVEQLKSAPIDDPLPETPNTQPADDEEAARIEQEHSDLNTWIKAAWKQAGGDDAQFETWVREKDLYNWTIGRKRSALEKLNEKARKLQEEKKSEPKSNEPASELPAKDKARTRKASGQDANEESKREKALVENNKQPGNQGAKLKGAVDDLCAEFWPDDNLAGYKACREKAVTITGTYWRNWDELSADDAAKVLAMFSRWNPADDKPKGKGKK